MLPLKTIIGKSPVSTLANGLYSLTDLWRQSKRETKDRPNDWLRNRRTQGIILGITRSTGKSPVIMSIHGGPDQGNYASLELAMAYAQHLGLLDAPLAKPTRAPAPAPVALPSQFAIGDKLVATNVDGLVSLTDLHKASGKSVHHRPTFWLRQSDTVEFSAALAEKLNVTVDHICQSKRGGGGGTFAHWQIALAYAKYLSPELHMAVNEIFMRYQTGDATLAEEVIDKVEDPADLERIEKRARAKKQYKRLASVVFAKGGGLFFINQIKIDRECSKVSIIQTALLFG